MINYRNSHSDNDAMYYVKVYRSGSNVYSNAIKIFGKDYTVDTNLANNEVILNLSTYCNVTALSDLPFDLVLSS